MDLTKFPQLSRLAPEIRNMIWRLSVVPRIVILRLDAIFTLQNARRAQDYTLEQHDSDWENLCEPDGSRKHDNARFLRKYSGDWIPVPQYVLSSPTIVPLMNVCKESQSIVEPMYSKLYYRGEKSSLTKPILFDFEHDTFYSDFNENFAFGNSTWTSILRADPHPVKSVIGDDRLKIQRIATGPGKNYSHLNYILCSYVNVHTVTIVDRAHHQYASEIIELDPVYDIDASLTYFEMEESEYFEGMEEIRIAEELEHHERVMEGSQRLYRIFNK
jgi:hypothetical protein